MGKVSGLQRVDYAVSHAFLVASKQNHGVLKGVYNFISKIYLHYESIRYLCFKYASSKYMNPFHAVSPPIKHTTKAMYCAVFRSKPLRKVSRDSMIRV